MSNIEVIMKFVRDLCMGLIIGIGLCLSPWFTLIVMCSIFLFMGIFMPQGE